MMSCNTCGRRYAGTVAFLRCPLDGGALTLEPKPAFDGGVLEGGVLLEDVLASGPMPVRRALEIGLFVARALERANERGLVHGDLRPQTVHVREALGDAQLLPPLFVHDYGPGTLPVTGVPPQEYTAPARSRGATVANDLYSLGCILMELLTGSPPFVGDMTKLDLEHARTPPPVPSSRRPELSPAIDSCMLRLLAKDPAERFASARELADALAELTERALEAAPRT